MLSSDEVSQMKRNSESQQLLAKNIRSTKKADILRNNYKYWNYSSQAISLHMKGEFLT